MKLIDNALNSITGYLLSINRNTEKGWYELNIGLPKSWVVNETKDIAITIVAQDDNGKLITVLPKNDSVVVDDLVIFVELIIETNKKILEKENEFKRKMEEFKKNLELETAKYYNELDELKDSSFKNLSEELEVKKKGRKPKDKVISYSGTTS